MDSQYDKLLEYLGRLIDAEFITLFRSVLSPEDQNNVSPQRLDFLHSMRVWGRLEEVEQYLSKNYPDRITEPLSSREVDKPFPFFNQEETRKRIFSSSAQYCLLDAPAGYGKTALLKELREDFQKESWRCIYVSADGHQTIDQLLTAILAGIGENTTFSENMTYERLVSRLAGALKQEPKSDRNETTRGVVLMVDLGAYPSPLILGKFIDFIKLLYRYLKTYEFFKIREKRFRVIIAGRYLGVRSEMVGIPISIIQLPPFRYNDLLDFIESYFNRLYIEDVKQITAHIMYLSGGHPGFIASLIRLYAKDTPPPDIFLSSYSDEEIIRKISDIRNDLPEDMRDIMDVISLCRRFNCRILDRLIDQDLIQYKGGDGVALSDELQNAYLVGRQGDFLKDGITRRLLAFRFLHERPTDYINMRLELENIYHSLLVSNALNPEAIVVELLYQKLHIGYYRCDHQKSEARQDLSKEFYLQFDTYLNALTAIRDYPRESIDILQNTLEQDWEFQFTLNYFLRQDVYSEQPYSQLKQRLANLARKLTSTSPTLSISGVVADSSP